MSLHILDLFFMLSFQRDEGISLVSEAICSGIFNDLGSGSNVDICVITKVRYLSAFVIFRKNMRNLLRSIFYIAVSHLVYNGTGPEGVPEEPYVAKSTHLHQCQRLLFS